MAFISSAAAYCAVKLHPLVKEYMNPSQTSGEPGAKYILDELKLQTHVKPRHEIRGRNRLYFW